MATRKKSSSKATGSGRVGARSSRKAPERATRSRKSDLPDQEEDVGDGDSDAGDEEESAVAQRNGTAEVAARPRAAAVAPRAPAPPIAPERRPLAAPAPIPARAGPRPFVVARGEDPIRVFSETLKHSGFFDAIENAQIKSGKKRELYEVACKVDFMRAVRVESEPVSYVDPRLVKHLFSELLDHGFRILRVVEVRNELSRYLKVRSVKEVGKALGYDESCYELRDLADELAPVDLGAAGRRATGRLWKAADFRIVFAKNRTDEAFGPALALWNVWRTLATPTDLIALEYGIDPGEFALAMLEKLPVHFALIDSTFARDGSPGNVFPYEALRDGEGPAIDGAQLHRPGTVIAGTDVLAVESAGQRMQGLDPTADPVFLKRLRKATGWKPPAEVDGLPTFPGWKGIGSRIRDLLGPEKLADNSRVALLATLAQADPRLFPPQPSAFQQIRLRVKVEQIAEELRRRRGIVAPPAPLEAAAPPNSAPPPPPPPNANPASFGE